MSAIIPPLTDSERSPAEYAKLRMSVGSQGQVSRAIGVDISTLSRRENGTKLIGVEAVLCLRYLQEHPLQFEQEPTSDESPTEDRADQDSPEE
jgi:DNA-binding transcriptional regulator YiaG